MAYARDFVTKNIDHFVDPEDETVKSISKVAAAQADIITAKFGLRPEVTPRLVKLAFYDFIILCGQLILFSSAEKQVGSSLIIAEYLLLDDSSSMKFDAQRVPALFDTLRRVAQFTTILEPKGISVRFLNHDEGTGRHYDDLTDAHNIMMKVAQVPFHGNTRLGQVLHEKIVQPMIIQKAVLGKLKKPVFVIIITDGEVSYCLHCMKLYVSHLCTSKRFKGVRS